MPFVLIIFSFISVFLCLQLIIISPKINIQSSFFFIYQCLTVMLVSFTMPANGCVYETFGISKRFPVKLQLLLIRAETLDKPLTAKCFIHVVRAMCIIFLEVFKYKFHYFVFTQTDFFLIPNFRFRSHILNFSLLSKMII